jgi:hypothetical protein
MNTARPAKPVLVKIKPEWLPIVRKYAKNAEIGGKSSVRLDEEDRQRNLSKDQWNGQMGNIALSLYLTGSIDLYIRTRDYRDAHPFEGDGGCDLLGYQIDIKTSEVYPWKRPEEYHLWVTEGEYIPAWTYMQALILPRDLNTVRIYGWAHSEDLRPPAGKPRKYELNIPELWQLPKRAVLPDTITY